ncbi:MAG: ATP-binding protein [Proteobacteria bacterium]|nr:MAG: ATP-binding protein [Pseudomonadota bacterium]
MNIELKSGEYKSIKAPFEWLNVPDFAVVVGKNGSGKSQLLRLISLTLRPEEAERAHLNLPTLTIEGIDARPHQVAYIQTLWYAGNSSPINLGVLQGEAQQFLDLLKAERTGAHVRNYPNRLTKETFQELIRKIALPFGKTIDTITEEEFLGAYSMELLTSGDVNLGNLIARVYFKYFIDSSELAMSLGSTRRDERISQSLGKPPWLEVDELLESIGIRYRTTVPTTLQKAFELQLIQLDTNAHVQFPDLSSGEQTIVALILWLFLANRFSVTPRLLIMDEPDAHLHPSLRYTFLNVLQNIFVKKYGVKVIMSTHSPDTVSYVPPESLFEMRTESPRIQRVQNKANAITSLTSNLVVVLEGTKYVFVEDEDDANCYAAIFSALKNKSMIASYPSLAFISASSGKGKVKIPGGKTVVNSWLRKLGETGLSKLSTELSTEIQTLMSIRVRDFSVWTDIAWKITCLIRSTSSPLWYRPEIPLCGRSI